MRKTPDMRDDRHKWATGHRPHITGAGAHDPRPNRQRTRSAARNAAIKEW